MTARVPLLVAVLAVATDSAVAQTPTFSSRVEAVRVDVRVTDKGRPVTGLGPADFQVTDNGVLQEVDMVRSDQVPLNVVLALDMSNSVAGEKLEHLRTAGHALLDGLKKDDQAALLTFSHVLALRANLTTDVECVRVALDQAEAVGDTALVDAAYAGLMLGESDTRRALLLVFSDGLDTASWLAPDDVVDAAKRGISVVYGVSVGGKPAFLRDLSELTGGSLFQVKSTTELSAIFLRILDEFRHSYLVSYSPRGVSMSGWHKLDVRVKRRSVNVKARPGYLAGP
jgi:VWFA-related protein